MLIAFRGAYRPKHLIIVPVRSYTPIFGVMKTKLSSTQVVSKGKSTEIKTEPPISEKDEVKKAEDRGRTAAKKKF